ncbi:class I SAM-dependent methyltransferase [Niabella hibiscisoli]|uniref:class I SAM-dependent methyltransferase n=1 Tax=Niabella hibiscisoli TaxID=1825928 RepID=UPI001F0DC9AF|nr:class I SAM-dependent methyltransferase [Niabella hibiscisoli]MCH5718098.1 class I SAM-dependent methyltransferase [Niabella hibiscisoli]
MDKHKILKGNPTDKENYTQSLITRQSKWWKKLLNVQYPYKKNIQSINPGFVLDIGCGVGRNLLHLNGHGIGIDHNPTSVEICTSQGLKAYTNIDFEQSSYNKPQTFDAILLAHVAEHMTQKDTVALLAQYQHLLKPNGKIILITPRKQALNQMIHMWSLWILIK